MEVLEVAKRIEAKIRRLEEGRGKLQELAANRAVKLAQYDCQLAVTIIKLRNGEAMKLQDETVKDPPATIIEKLAKGICWQEKLDMEQADTEYKLAVKKLDCVQAELNGYQSINRYLDVH
jgi:hypothetical protein